MSDDPSSSLARGSPESVGRARWRRFTPTTSWWRAASRQLGVLAAVTAPDDGLAAAVVEWQRRRDEMLRQLDGLRVATMPMLGWGDEIGARHVQFVFSNEPVPRLSGLGDRVRRALT